VPTPTPTPTIPPTIEAAAVSASIASAETRVAAEGGDPLCLRQQDTDADGEPEWVGLYHYPSDPPELRAFVIDGTTWYDLLPPEGDEEGSTLGEYPTCDLVVRDINTDGRVEIAVIGHEGTQTDFLHIFVWDGATYRRLAALKGEGGIRLENADGDLSDEILVRFRPEGDLVWEVVYAWDGTNYAWTWDRFVWFYLDRPHVYRDDTPLHAVASYYLALGDRDLPGAYSLLSANAQGAQPYTEWTWAFNTTLNIEVGAISSAVEEGDSATIRAQVQAIDNVEGRAVLYHTAVDWQLVWEGGWRLNSSVVDPLDQWELPYYR
jgi:hypothetical protein